ncbi:MAG TPA: site-2 protease family protein [bacterium]|nr:site-2 protease family protein [bacterium]
MTGSLRIARIFGIPIEVHATWLIVFVLIAWSLATGYFPSVGPELGMPTLIVLGVSAAILFFAALLLHELAHAYVAIREGLPVRSITLFIFGGVAQMTREPRSAGAEFRMAIAGPLTSVAIGFVFVLLARLAGRLELSSALRVLFQYLGFINIAVAVFNMLPAFPLDGGRVFRSILWYFTRDMTRATRAASLVGEAFAYVLMGLGLFRVLGGNAVGGLWTLFIGWFLLQAAQSGYRQVQIRRALRGVEARDVMRERVSAVPANLTLAEFVHEHLMRSRDSEFCVTDNGHLRGLISLDDVKRVPRERWDEVTVQEAMTHENACPTVRPSQSAYEALMLLGSEAVSQIAVRDGTRLVGTISRQDLLGYIRNRLALQG